MLNLKTLDHKRSFLNFSTILLLLIGHSVIIVITVVIVVVVVIVSVVIIVVITVRTLTKIRRKKNRGAIQQAKSVIRGMGWSSAIAKFEKMNRFRHRGFFKTSI